MDSNSLRHATVFPAQLLACAIGASWLVPMTASAGVTISSEATTNMSCSGGICSPTAANAVLNVGDLETLLSTESVKVTTIGIGVRTDNIRVTAPLTWSSTVRLTLHARRSVVIDQPVGVTGSGTLAIFTGGKNGTFSIERKGNVQFPSGGSLIINGANYTLVNSIASLASAVASNSSGNYALAQDYDASGDGIYESSPVPTLFSGNVDGLGNVISHLSIDVDVVTKNMDPHVGLFSYLDPGSSVEHLGLEHVTIKELVTTGPTGFSVGALAGFSQGYMYQDHVSGKVEAENGPVGGLVGQASYIVSSYSNARVIGLGNESNAGSLVGIGGEIANCYATGDVMGGGSAFAVGGLAGVAYSVANSFATGNARVQPTATGAAVGGLVGFLNGKITNSYATGAAISTVPKHTKNPAVKVGGFVGDAAGKISYSYSVGRVHAASFQNGNYGIFKGGFVAIVQVSGSKAYTDTYWDTVTSKDDQGSWTEWSGITGLTTEQLQSGLPAGFDPAVWAENPSINNGLPYLKSNPPRK